MTSETRQVFASLGSVLLKWHLCRSGMTGNLHLCIQLYFSLYLLRLFFASLSVNKLKMLPLYCVAFVSYALSALILNASLVVLTSPPQSMSSWNFILVEFLLERILVWGTTPITAHSLTLHSHFSIHHCLTLLLQVAYPTCQDPLSHLSHSD